MARLHGTEPERELAGAEPHVDRHHVQLVQRLDKLVLGRRRQGDDDGVDAVEAHVAHQIVDRAQDGVAHAAPRQGGRVIVVDAQDARATRGGVQAAQQPLGHGAGADDGDQLAQTAGTMPVLDLVVERDATRHDHGRTEGEPQGGPGAVGGGDRIEEEGGDEQRTQRQQPAEQRPADRGAEIAEVAKAIGAGEAQEVAGEQRAQQDDETFETPVDGRGIEMDRGRAGAQDGDDVESPRRSGRRLIPKQSGPGAADRHPNRRSRHRGRGRCRLVVRDRVLSISPRRHAS